MTRIKDLRNNPENNINFVDILSLVCPNGQSKYVETLLRIMKSTPNIGDHVKEIKKSLKTELNLSENDLTNFSDMQLMVIHRFLDTYTRFDDLKKFTKFCEYNERGLIVENDLSIYTSFDQVLTQLGIAEMKSMEKEMENQTIKIYEDETWVIIRPLTFASALKYGASTKWCTSMENNPDYFFKYTHRGILIYNINKKTGVKVACFKSLDVKDPEFSFWNQIDVRIDSLESGLPDSIISIIREEITNNSVTNESFVSKEDLKKQKDLLKMNNKSLSSGDEMEEEEMETIEVEPTVQAERVEDFAVQEMELRNERGGNGRQSVVEEEMDWKTDVLASLYEGKQLEETPPEEGPSDERQPTSLGRIINRLTRG